MKKYEYKIESKNYAQNGSTEKAYLQVQGNECWELVCVIKAYATDDTYVYYWKRVRY